MSNDLSSIVIVWFNVKNYQINYYQIYKLVKKKSQDVYIFLTSHTGSETRNENFVTSKKLL